MALKWYFSLEWLYAVISYLFLLFEGSVNNFAFFYFDTRYLSRTATRQSIEHLGTDLNLDTYKYR